METNRGGFSASIGEYNQSISLIRMKLVCYLLSFLATTTFLQCRSEPKPPTGFSLSPTEFAKKIIEYPAAPVIDVRSADEFSKSHIEHAVNLDVNSNFFTRDLANLDRSGPLLVYCLSGARSNTAAEQLRSLGFASVYELDGGLLNWRAANFPVVTSSSSPDATGMTKEEFERKLTSGKLVLVDFYADWCAPCRKMKPFLEEIAVEMKDRVEVVRIDADDHAQLCKDLDVVSLPTLLLYKHTTLTWEHRGFLEKDDIIRVLK